MFLHIICCSPLVADQRLRYNPGALINAILDMIMLEPVNWVSVQNSIFASVQKVSASSAAGTTIDILNMGPGYGVSTSAFRLPSDVKIRDVMSFASSPKSQREASRLVPDDIAIVGMAVDLPDASDVDSLWANLVGGVNSCSEVCQSFFSTEHSHLPGADIDTGVEISHRRLLPGKGAEEGQRWSYPQHKIRQLPSEPLPIR